ncbi:putative integral membrane protein [Cytobacillus firmus]|uniref:Putative integral membrane protein n=2 Tax=Cytobacillus TaxID=2675230 RepID=A0A366JX48_CYTFI|nr:MULTISPECIES: lipopolysaccharide assembly LapA domain-containing protein [Cytobacillus]RBP94014.1 putative integral membrane protein [Cytobacillus firmus]TDX47572.1 putative integral membrane protein [Cytobacillus oceanisediminis]
MKFQWALLFGFLFALIVAVFAVINVDDVTVNYLFGESQWPLILVILGSVLMGGLIVGSVGLVRIYSLQRKVRILKRENEKLKAGNEVKDHADKEELEKELDRDIH